MGYKVLGYLVWRGAKWYVRKRVSEQRRRMAFAGISVVVVAGAIAAQRGSRSTAG
jgi:hypothetical protein